MTLERIPLEWCVTHAEPPDGSKVLGYRPPDNYELERFTCTRAHIEDWQRNYNCKIKTILEVGCGLGVFMMQVATECPEYEITGIDPEPEYIVEANKFKAKRKLNNLEFICSDYRDYKTDLKFDIVMCCEVLEHLKDWQDCVKWCYNHLSEPSGRLLISVPDSGKILDKDHKTVFTQDMFDYIPYKHWVYSCPDYWLLWYADRWELQDVFE